MTRPTWASISAIRVPESSLIRTSAASIRSLRRSSIRTGGSRPSARSRSASGGCCSPTRRIACERRQPSLDVGLQLLAQLGGALLHRLGHLVEVGDHPGRLLVERRRLESRASILRTRPVWSSRISCRAGRGDVLHHAGEVGVHVVEAALRARLRFPQPSVDRLAHRVLELLVAGVRLLDGGRQRLQLLAKGLTHASRSAALDERRRSTSAIIALRSDRAQPGRPR